MPASLDELLNRWRTRADAATTLALCDALYRAPNDTLVTEVGDAAVASYGNDATLLVAVSKMYTGIERFAEAQNLLVTAGKLAPRDAAVYRWLGEVLLRKGDAERAEKVLERAVRLGSTDPDVRVWLDRAQVFRPMQARGGTRMVAAEIARTQAPNSGAPRPRMESSSDDPTEVLPSDVRAKFRRSTPSPTEAASDAETEELPAELRAQLLRETSPPPMRYGALPAIPPLSPPPMRARASSTPSPSASPEQPRPPLSINTGAEVFRAPPPPVPAMPAYSSGRTPSPLSQDTDEPTIAGRVLPAAGAPPPKPAYAPPEPPPRSPPSYPAQRASQQPPQLSGGQPKPTTPHPRDVLDALALAGIFEPDARTPPGVGAWDRSAAPASRRGSLALVAILLLSIAGGSATFAFIKDRREKQHREAEIVLAKVEADLDYGASASLEPMEKSLATAFELDSRSPRAALDWLRERGLRGLVRGGESIAFEDSIARAKEVGVRDEQVAFARLASFLFQNDTAGAAALLSKWDGPAANDAWYQLLAAATLERAGDGRAVERYIAAQKLDSHMVIAQIALVRVIALEGDPERAKELANELRTRFPDRAEAVALVALAWARQPVRSEPPPPEVAQVAARASELPLGLASVPHAVAAIHAIAAHTPDDARAAIMKGLVAADGPGMATWFGHIALDLGDEALARKAALTAVRFSASYAPARVLAARVALLGDRLDDALKATEDLDAASPEVAVVRAATAYERSDADGLARALDALPAEARKLPLLAGLVHAPAVLAGRVKPSLDIAKALEAAGSNAPWSDVVGMDLALDTGNLAAAQAYAASWKEDTSRPSRAVRLSRLARLEEKLDVAETMSHAALTKGVVTVRVIVERVFVLVARQRYAEVGPLLARNPAVVGTTLTTWLGAFATGASGKTEQARGSTAAFDPPPALAPLPARLVGAAALGAMHDRKRGPEYVRDLLVAGVESEEVEKAAIALGFRKVERGGRRPTYEKP